MAKTKLCIAVLLLFSAWAFPLFSQQEGTVSTEKPTPPELRMKWFRDHQKLKETSPFRGLQWKSIGPVEMSGRITDIAAPRGKPYTYYVSAASGGVWKTVNNGTTWEPVWDDQASNSVGDIAVAPSDPEIVWVGAGENNSSRSSYSGTGVYKSGDGGSSWRHMGLTDTHHIGRIVIHPQNADIVYVAALGHLYSENEERGIFKTTDGGKTWNKILTINDNTGVIDLVMDPANSEILYAAAWERVRKAWNMTEHGKGSGIFKTTDGGSTWKMLTQGLPSGDFVGRIGLDVSPSDPNVIYAVIDNHNPRPDEKAEGQDPYGIAELEKFIIGAEVFRSADRGETWAKVNEDDLGSLYSTYGYYFGEIRVSPDNPEEIYVLGVPLLRSVDGGKTYERLSYRGLHGDHQALWIDPRNPDHLVDGNDGGINFSYDRGKTWLDVPMPLGQFYFVTVDMEIPFNVYGSIQDNGCWFGPVTSVPYDLGAWKSFPGGEASYIAIDPSDPDTLYSEGYYGSIQRLDRKTGEVKDIRPKAKENEPSLRCNWLTPFILSPHNPYVLYFGSQRLHMSLDRGDRWVPISPDLSTNNPQKKGDVPYGTITTISESAFRPGLIYVGTDDGNVQMTENGGAEWKKIMAGLPALKWVTRIVASQHEEETVYVSLNGYRDDDFAAYVFGSNDYGKTWEDLGKGLPGGPVNVIKEDPKKKSILYAGTDLGVYVSLDKGQSWSCLGDGLPNTFVHDLVIHPRDDVLVIGTHGRSVYVLDAHVIQNYTEDIAAKNLHVFPIKPVIPLMRTRLRQNADIYFAVPKEHKVRAEIKDGDGKTIDAMEMEAKPGINKLSWDLIVVDEEGRSKTAVPGRYTVSLKAGQAAVSGTLELKKPDWERQL